MTVSVKALEAEIAEMIEKILDAQQDVNFVANSTMDQSLCDVSALIDDLDKLLRRILSALSNQDAEPVAWQRKHPTEGWMEVRHEDIPHYQSSGQEIRSVFTHPPQPDSLRNAVLEAHDMLLNMYRVWIADDSEAYPRPDTDLAKLLSRLSSIRALQTKPEGE